MLTQEKRLRLLRAEIAELEDYGRQHKLSLNHRVLEGSSEQDQADARVNQQYDRLSGGNRTAGRQMHYMEKWYQKQLGSALRSMAK